MPSTFKDIGMGLAAGMGIGTLLFAGVFLISEFAQIPDVQSVAAQEAIIPPQLEAQANPAQTLFSTPTIFSVPEFFPTPTPTLIPLEKQSTTLPPTATIITEPLILTGPLNGEEQAYLHLTSLYFVAPDYFASKAIGEEINGVGYGHPSNICGPLSIAILQRGNILSKNIIPYDFWLLNPDNYEDRLILKATFPQERFESFRTKIALDRFDWVSFPLLAGDFLYLYSGSRGNFEHMLTVTRVDDLGRAYTVTNHKTEELGFVITEELLYDPKNPGEGLFYQWTAREKATLGATGFEGFQLFRLREK
ncbi:MAG: hypothetical protein ISR59_12050 [Anaerolineales bacterium]|uniref:Uncharacterized protein n=1 Tax=Candidatus Desulfolinea nitratireducens TaxID=2841698 RepID=A0A8J6NKZ2_9CHLR|nr:hypothetical protein [Candidatus Desulfolinea nitratireducens]MBL6961831.1 hypothetical protein [Anaerolineales bacterium]